MIDLKPSVHFVQFRHDDLCLTLETQRMSDCTCKTLESRVVTKDQWLTGVKAQNRAQRRAAEKAQRATAKAAKRGDAK